MKRSAWFAQLKPLLWLTLVTSAFLIEQSAYTLDIIVTSAENAGSGTLRQAISDLNSGGGTGDNTITFAANIKTIYLLSPLPSIDKPVTINGFMSEIDCTQWSPTDNPEQFSNAITVTIDGSQMPTSGFDPLIGITICASNVVIRGVRIANFTNIEDAQVAGIVTNGDNTLIECCEITELTSNTAETIGIHGHRLPPIGNSDTIISKCFIHHLHSTNHNVTNTNIATGDIYGITLFKTISDCRIENLQSGNIVYTTPGTATILAIATGSVNGISVKALHTDSCLARSRACEFSLTDPDLLIKNSIINCCKSGSIVATQDANAFIDAANGITILGGAMSGPRSLIIKDCTIHKILTGNATLSDAQFNLAVNHTRGITVSELPTEITNSIIQEVVRGSVEIDGNNSAAILYSTAGIHYDNIRGSSMTLAGNNISQIHCKTVINTGFCTIIEDSSNLSSLNPSCIGNVISPFIAKNPICSGIEVAPINIQMCNNTVTNINAGKRIAKGEQSLITSGYAAGVWAEAQDISAEDNTIQDIFGAELIAGPAARGIFGGIGSRGLALWSIDDSLNFKIAAVRNTIKRVCEQTLNAVNSTPGEYIFAESILIPPEKLKASAQTIGISIKTTKDNNPMPENIIVENNTIRDISGAAVNGGTPGVGTIAIAIGIEASAIQEPCLDVKNVIKPSIVQGNTIQNIRGGTKNAAYGILINGTNTALNVIDQFNTTLPLLFAIQNNVISNVIGFGTPQTFKAPLITINDCGTIDQEIITFVPFPYQPTSGIYMLFGNCCTIGGNTITTITDPNSNARGITTQASNDIDINANTISKINGYGIFVGGAVAGPEFINSTSGLFDQIQFEDFFASSRNKIVNNSTFDNTKQGIELGLIDWNNYFKASLICKPGSETRLKFNQEILNDSVAIYGNHGQIKPRIIEAKHNRDCTITITYSFDSLRQPFTKFALQFFTNNTNTVPHGKSHINEINDPRFKFKTDIHGRASGSITFTPLAQVNNGDIISAHVTVSSIGQSTSVNSKYKGDTSRFSVESDGGQCPSIITTRPPSTQNQKPGFASILSR